MMYFLSYSSATGTEIIRRFSTMELLWEAIQNYTNQFGAYPKAMLVFKTDCIFDGS